MFVALVVIALYFLPYFITLGPIGRSLTISDIGVIIAATTFALSFILYVFAPHERVRPATLAVYSALIASAAILVASTGSLHSPFVTLWIIVNIFGGVFGLVGVGLIATSIVLYMLYDIVTARVFHFELIWLAIFIGVIPLLASYILFHFRSKRPPGDSSYTRLASELSHETSKASAVLSAIDDGVIAVDAKGVIELINPAAERIIGWGNTDALGLDYRSVLKLTNAQHQPLDNTTDPVVQVLLTNHDIHTNDLAATTQSGKHLLLSIVVSPIGQIGQGVIIVFRDITHEKAEEREQGEFISTASHEMRTPVASIEGYLGLALNPATAQIDDKAREFITKAHESAQHLGRLFQDLLDVSKAEDGRLSNHPKIIDVVEFADDIVEGLRPKAQDKQLRLFYKPRPDTNEESESRTLSPVFYVNADEDHLREILNNLVENAIKYTPSGDVIVDINGDNDHVRISIKDSGIGIPREDVPHLFQKFYRVDNSATREIGGTGLGLYLCRRLAEVMGGRIWVESEFKKGSTFFVELPRTDRDTAMHMIDEAVAAADSNAGPAITALHGTSDSYTTPSPLIATDDTELQTVSTASAQATDLIEHQATVAPTQDEQAPTSSASSLESPQPPTLEAIEQNPSAYTAQRPQASLQIPVRDSNNPNKP